MPQIKPLKARTLCWQANLSAWTRDQHAKADSHQAKEHSAPKLAGKPTAPSAQRPPAPTKKPEKDPAPVTTTPPTPPTLPATRDEEMKSSSPSLTASTLTPKQDSEVQPDWNIEGEDFTTLMSEREPLSLYREQGSRLVDPEQRRTVVQLRRRGKQRRCIWPSCSNKRRRWLTFHSNFKRMYQKYANIFY